MVMPGEIVAFDVETTGFSPTRGDRVIEIGAVRIVDGELSDEFQSLVAFRGSIPKAAQRVHGITGDMLLGQPEPFEVFNAFRQFIGQAVLAAHNAVFDLDFLRSEFSRLGWPLRNRSICTLKESRRRVRWLPNYRLETVARRLLGPLPPDRRRHRAMEDAKLVARVWLALRDVR
jgi:DNA polymerase-3 subunit epsilon